MPAIHVSRSIDINKAPAHIAEVITDFTRWRPWSPWLIMEPEAEMTIAEDGKSYCWKGNRVGEGSMTQEALENSENLLKFKLAILAPWKSKADVSFSLEPKANENDAPVTQVTWTMDSSLPFFLFAMKKKMEFFVGMDYERGLNMLKDYVETGAVQSKVELSGQSDFAGFNYVGIKDSCPFKEIGPKMQEVFCKLKAYKDESGIECSAPPFAQYQEWDISKGATTFTCGLPVETAPETIPDGFVTARIPKCRLYTVTHTGPYKHLGNAWSTGMAMQRNKEIQSAKIVPPFEQYENDPHEVDENELITKIHFPLK